MELLYQGASEPNLLYFPGLFGDNPIPIYNMIQIGPVRVTFYGLLIASGMLLAMIYAFKVFRKVGVDPDKAIDAIIGGIIGGVLGARIYFVAFNWDSYGLDFSSWDSFWSTFFRLFKTWEGGMAIYGGLIGALLVGGLVAKWRNISLPVLLDVVGIGFLLGQGIGRWGNFFNVEAFGDNTTLPWGMTSESISRYLAIHQSSLEKIGVSIDPQVPVHPTFFYESVWCLIGFVLLALYLKHRKFDGEVFLIYLAYYGAERFLVEGLRTDSLMIGSLRVSQLLAGVLVLASILAILIIRSKIKGNHDENYLKLFVLTEEGQRIAQKLPPLKEEAVQGNQDKEPAAKEEKQDGSDH